MSLADEYAEEEQVIRDWLAGQLNPVTGAPRPPLERLSLPLPGRRVVAVVDTLIQLLDEARRERDGKLPPADIGPHFPPLVDAVWHSVRGLQHWRTAGEFEDILHSHGVCLSRSDLE